MRITLVTSGDPTVNPRCRPLVSVLLAAGHRVTVVSPRTEDILSGVDHRSARPTRLMRWQARLTGADAATDAIVRATAASSPDLVYPLRERDVSIADAVSEAWSLSRPGWVSPQRDFVWAGPGGQGLEEPTTSDAPAAGRSVDIVARFTATSPAQYLADGLEHLGVVVRRWDGSIDWGDVPPDSAAVIYVESPYPAMDAAGARHADVPILFWVHHGEHHQPANVRLADRYQADAVLMAHSWHLAHQYPQPVYALPFGVPTTLLSATQPNYSDRTIDVAMVGAGLDAVDGWYGRRGERVRQIEAQGSMRSIFRYGMLPAEMISLYEDAKVVINDGGAQHHPITMRVFEAIGAGAALATEPAPGLGALFDEGTDFTTLHTTTADEVERLLTGPDTAARAAKAHRKALDAHTYQHRAQRVLDIAASLEPGEQRHPRQPATSVGVAAVVDRDVEVQSVLVSGSLESGMDLRDREVRHLTSDDAYRPRSFDAAVLSTGGEEMAIELAREYVYVSGNAPELVDAARRLLP
ncbi:MAG: glycosyltransferase, partial [Acidimicrobiia bacterium]|nr:glycosyltransferase [Acidimicrobiia bacterium]